MIVVELKGGLGNQLFQYAAARALAAKHGTGVAFDATHYHEDQLRNFELLHMKVAARKATSGEVAALKPHSFFDRLRNRLAPYERKRFYKQPFFHYDKQFFRLPAKVYLRGYFQSARYFEPVAEIIRQEFRFQQPMPPAVEELGRRLRSEESVSIHIRRGDYKNPETLRVHGIQPLAYYEAAVQLLRERINAPLFYIFTDDPGWVRKNLSIEGAQLVSGPVSATHFEDLYLMQQCRHNIIANSSFSWWGAWLNDNAQKMVIAPNTWFNEGPKDTQNLIPGTWLRL
ncbi:alpha-1,2-fucosyltransferase [Flaviaesturariibacter flavus]|nr:alpha-1,2-fucosyltransferase [Flaviaesturariibacter flavus]